jgi:hypothetical protein
MIARKRGPKKTTLRPYHEVPEDGSTVAAIA